MIKHHTIKANNINLHIATLGTGAPVVLCHGNPGLWYTWRHQMEALADAGYTAIAYDARGFGQSDRPLDAMAYDSEQQIADVLGILDALGYERATFIGHDFGAALVCNLAVRAPERVEAIVVMSCPYDFDLSGRSGAGSNPPENDARYRDLAFASPYIKPTDCFSRISEQHFIHFHYFQEIGPADAELGNNVREYLYRLFWALSAEGNLLEWQHFSSAGTGYLDVLAEPASELPWSWLTQTDLGYYVAEYERSGPETACIGGLNLYRVADRNWQIGLAWADRNIEVPCQFIAGQCDPVLNMISADALDTMQSRCSDLRSIELIPDAGHFVQMEQPAQTNAAILGFLQTLAH